MRILAAVIFSLSLFVANAKAQTAEQFASRYHSSIQYEVRPKVSMIAEFAADGQVCHVFLQPNHLSFTTSTQYFGNDSLSLADLKEIFDELAPPSTRVGEPKNLGVNFNGSMFFSALEYRNIRFNLGGPSGFGDRRKTLRDPTEDAPHSSNASDIQLDQFLNPGLPQVETASITWTDRKCKE